MHRTPQTRLTALTATAAAIAAISCGDVTPETGPRAGDDPATETRQGAITTPSRALDPRARFFIAPPAAGAVQQIVDLVKGRKLVDAARIAAMEATPHAVWFTEGTPSRLATSDCVNPPA